MINLKIFKIISFLEGISLLLLYFFSMPMKHFFDEPIYVKHIGMAHGVLFILYVIYVLMLWYKKNIDLKQMIIFNFLSLIPFGFYYLDKKYLQ